MEAPGLSPPEQGVMHGIVSGFIAAPAKCGETYDPEDDGYVQHFLYWCGNLHHNARITVDGKTVWQPGGQHYG
jgi:hypothetical protein